MIEFIIHRSWFTPKFHLPKDVSIVLCIVSSKLHTTSLLEVNCRCVSRETSLNGALVNKTFYTMGSLETSSELQLTWPWQRRSRQVNRIEAGWIQT